MPVRGDDFIKKTENVSCVGQCNILSENTVVIDDKFVCLFVCLYIRQM
jgi:hypothetical protein